MERAKCKKEDCGKDAISFSDYCGEHSDPEAVVATLNALKGKHENIYLDNIELENLKWEDIELEFPNFIDVHFSECSFINCRFYFGGFTNIDLSECEFEDCLFEEATEFQSSSFDDSTFVNVTFNEVNFNQSEFQFGTILRGCYFENGNLIGSGFHEMELYDTRFNLMHFNQSSFNRCFVRGVEIIDSNIYKTILSDTNFEDCLFKNNENDFHELVDSIELCLFANTKFENTFTSEHFEKWNGIDEKPLDFYERILNIVENETIQTVVSKPN